MIAGAFEAWTMILDFLVDATMGLVFLFCEMGEHILEQGCMNAKSPLSKSDIL